MSAIHVSSMVGCPPADDVAAWVTSTPAARDRLNAADAPRVSIVLAGSTPTIEGVLTLNDLERRVSGSRCEDVARAVATIARLALESLPASASPSASAPVRPPNASASASASVSSPPPRPPLPTHYSTGASLALRTGAPSLAYAAGAFVDVSRARWSARLTALATTSPESTTMDDLSASLGWTLGTVDLCGTLLRHARLGLSACGALEAGVLRAQGDVTESRPWVAPGAELRARLAASGSLAVELSAGARIPLIRDSFVFEPDVVWHDTPAALVQAGLNVSVSIP